MNDEVIEALKFYSNTDNYWSEPLSMENNYCRRTLQDVVKANKKNKILQDFGEKAKKALVILRNKNRPSAKDACMKCIDKEYPIEECIVKGENIFESDEDLVHYRFICPRCHHHWTCMFYEKD